MSQRKAHSRKRRTPVARQPEPPEWVPMAPAPGPAEIATPSPVPSPGPGVLRRFLAALAVFA